MSEERGKQNGVLLSVAWLKEQGISVKENNGYPVKTEEKWYLCVSVKKTKRYV